MLLPLGHHLIQDNVLWTEEGHRLSWRMMLRTKSGIACYNIVDKNSSKISTINFEDYLSQKQKRIARTKPDIMWQFAQRLKKNIKKKVKIFLYM